MKFLVIGLGSMGKRRVRNLRALGEQCVAGFDPRVDRREEAESKYGIATFPSFNERSEEHTSELQSLMRISYAVFCLKKKKKKSMHKQSFIITITVQSMYRQ